MEKEEYKKLMPLVNPKLYKSTLNKEMKQKKRKETKALQKLEEANAVEAEVVESQDALMQIDTVEANRKIKEDTGDEVDLEMVADLALTA